MESNFIKERVVVREKIIKENITDKKTGRLKQIPDVQQPPKSINLLEELVNDKLKQDLIDISQQVDSICETIADYLKIKSTLKIFKINSKDVRLQTNIGCNFYAQCHVDDASMVYLCVGKDYFLHMKLDEAIEMIELKEKQWTKRLDELQAKSAKIKAYIKIALEAMGRIYDL